jgi:ABC-type multidrug transport system ATPase subunit
MIKIDSLVKRYDRRTILNIHSFRFLKGMSYLLIGENGSGKSTLIKMMLRLVKPDCGTIDLKTNEIGFIPEKVYFPEFSTVKQFLKNLCLIRKFDDKEADARIDFFMQEWDLENKQLSKLSKGMRQKVLIIQAIMHMPKLYIFDEPLNGLDKVMQKKFLAYIQKLRLHKKTIIIATHYPKYYQGMGDIKVNLINGELYEKSN